MTVTSMQLALPVYSPAEDDVQLQESFLGFPPEIVRQWLPFVELKTYPEYKREDLKLPLTGKEDENCLVLRGRSIFWKDLPDIAQQVYTVALCCKTFCTRTRPLRLLLKQASHWGISYLRDICDIMTTRLMSQRDIAPIHFPGLSAPVRREGHALLLDAPPGEDKRMQPLVKRGEKAHWLVQPVSEYKIGGERVRDVRVRVNSYYSHDPIVGSISKYDINEYSHINKLVRDVPFLTRENDPFFTSSLCDSFVEKIKQSELEKIVSDTHRYSPVLSSYTPAPPPLELPDFPALITKFFSLAKPAPDLNPGSIRRAYSFSSLLVSLLMSWRGGGATSLEELIVHAGKVMVTELALPLLTLAAAVEAVTYKALSRAVHALRPITEQPMKWAKTLRIDEREESSSFTISWTVWMLYHNLFKQRLPMTEDEARALHR
ncbi:MAG: hypothetical protein JSR46_12295 [Verrucomicrobia bacterium]|nr:hypothetical protein [Verrucomicrobiota bacterium]